MPLFVPNNVVARAAPMAEHTGEKLGLGIGVVADPVAGVGPGLNLAAIVLGG
jgi:hypothetical protein